MVDSQCHSFEDTAAAGSYNVPIISESHPGSSHDSGSVRRLQLTSPNTPLFNSPNGSQASVSLPKTTPHVIMYLKENQTAFTTPAKRGRSQFRAAFSRDTTRNLYRSPSSSDRFIPKRDFGDSPSTPFRVNKPPQQLSPRERLFRHRLPGDDPFLPTPSPSPVFPGQSTRPTRLRQRPLQRPRLVTDLAILGSNRQNDFLRQVSSGAVWGVGGTSAMLGDSAVTTVNGAPSFVGRASSAPTFMAKFLPRKSKVDDQNRHESRIALALDIDPTSRVLDNSRGCVQTAPHPTSPNYEQFEPFVWKDSAWKKGERGNWPTSFPRREAVPPKPFRILDAPYMRDDFYCSTLAYSFTSGVLAVGLAQSVYLWSEGYIVDRPPFGDVHPANYVTSLSFSSEDGGRSILAVGRQSGQLTLWSVFESKVRFEISHANSVSCVSFKPKTSRRSSEGYANTEIDAEDLVVGDEMGNIWYYAVEWPDVHDEWSWTGSMTLLAKISAHSQQVCGLAWSPDDRFLASGGNDNACMLFELHKILPSPPPNHPVVSTTSSDLAGNLSRAIPCLALGNNSGRSIRGRQIVSHLLPSWIHSLPTELSTAPPLLSRVGCLISGSDRTVLIPSSRRKHRLAHAAAVKAIAFAPWQPSLLATGGGSNDRAIHFFHAKTGVCLAKINVFAQVTSLIWSQTRREIAATFGYAQPEHPFRIAVFAWPSCAQIAVIPWGPAGASWDGQEQDVTYDCGRALWAVSYPGRPPRPLSVATDESDPLGSKMSAAGPSTSHQADERGQSVERRNESPERRRGPYAIRPKEKEGGMWCTRTKDEGCIIVASSDQTVKFHEVWTGRRKSTGSASGLLGGSDILEGIEGIEKSGSEVIR
ncbi:uncharacterized protein N7483_008701 [Penicillium malachiteum]|uniref:uncharacterized protein n=1 Tax=Penicillium malachiteum TaxID=1324776 RepID=UPI0025477168|nr:uncharacterized protein N7483_008701 [Penicillium malachiteum]KAJ5720767.1 hypothetical protein N7483_008701 [Penicillium malachiteum]